MVLTLEVVEVIYKGTFLWRGICKCGRFPAVLLKDNQVRPHVCAGFVCKEVVGQPYRTNKIRLLHHGLTDGLVTRGVHHALRGYESYQPAVTHVIECLQEEIVMYGLAGKSVRFILTACKGRVKDGNVTEGDIAGGYIETVTQLPAGGLVTFDMYVVTRIKGFQYLACQQVLLICRHLHIRASVPEGFHKRAAS